MLLEVRFTNVSDYLNMLLLPQIAEMTAKWRTEEKHLRDRLLTEQKKLTEKSESYQQKIIALQKQNATLSKQTKKAAMAVKQDSPMDSPII